MTLIVHILNHDKPLCGFTTEALAQWPQDHEGSTSTRSTTRWVTSTVRVAGSRPWCKRWSRYTSGTTARHGLITNGPLVAGSIQQRGGKWHVEILWSGVAGGDITFDGPTLESALAFVEAIEAGFGKRFTDNWLGRVK